MYITRTIRAMGLIPAGLVLNTRLGDTFRAFPDMQEVGAIPIMSGRSESGLISVPQATPTTLVQLRGDLLSPVLVQPLSVTLSAPQTAPDPLTDPCILLSNVLFDGEVIIYAGEDCPTHELVARRLPKSTGPSSKWDLSFRHAFPSWFVPIQLRDDRQVGITATIYETITKKGYRPITTKVSAEGLPPAAYGPDGLAVLARPIRITSDSVIGMARLGSDKQNCPVVMWTVPVQQNQLPAVPYINSIDSDESDLLVARGSNCYAVGRALTSELLKLTQAYTDVKASYYALVD